MNENVRIAKDLLRLAKMIAADDEEAGKEALRKQIESLKGDGDYVAFYQKYLDLCKEWKKQYPEELPPPPPEIRVN